MNLKIQDLNNLFDADTGELLGPVFDSIPNRNLSIPDVQRAAIAWVAEMDAAKSAELAEKDKEIAAKDAEIASARDAEAEKVAALSEHQELSDELYVKASPLLAALAKKAQEKGFESLAQIVTPLLAAVGELAAGPQGRIKAKLQAEKAELEAKLAALS